MNHVLTHLCIFCLKQEEIILYWLFAYLKSISKGGTVKWIIPRWKVLLMSTVVSYFLQFDQNVL